MTCIEDIILIKDTKNPTLVQRVQPSLITIPAYFKMPSILVELVERSNISIDIEMGEQRAEPMTNAGKGATSTYTLALTASSEQVGTSTVPHHPTVTKLISVPHEFL